MRIASLFASGLLCVVPTLLVACGGSSSDNGASGGSAGATAGGAGGTGGATAGGAGGTGGTGAVGGAGGAGGALPTNPITATDNTWTWVPFPGAHCRDGSSTGIGVNLNSASDKVVIYLEGGGACFNQIICASNPSKFGESDFNARKSSLAGIFDRSQAGNPLKDWNYVYVPYCTGDVHAGDNPNGSVPNVATKQEFVGYANMTRYLSRLVPTFPTASQVLLTGSSAGGFGSAANYLQTQRAFGSIPVDLLDDSGPPMPNPTIPGCLQDELRKMWNLDATVLKDCGSGCPDKSNFLEEMVQYAAKKYPARQLSVISSVADSTIRGFLSFGQNNCTYGAVSPQLYQQGLTDLRSQVKADSNFGTYYIGTCSGATPCSHHTWIGDNAHFYGTTVGGTALTDFVSALVSGSTSNVGP